MLPGTLSMPVTVMLSITNRCNLRCLHCEPDSGNALTNELTTDQWLALIDDLAQKKVFNVFVSGGEPLVRKDVFALLERLTRHRLAVTLFTNAIPVTEQVADRLSELSIHSVMVSLDGSKPETHDRLRGPGAFVGAIRGIERLRRRDLKVSATMVVNRFNMDDIPATVRLAQDSGLSGIAVNQLRAMGRANRFLDQIGLSREDNIRVAELLTSLQEKHDGFVGGTHLNRAKNYETSITSHRPRTMASCSACRQSAAVTADGKVVPCNYLRQMEAGSVLEHSFEDIWRSSPVMHQFRALSQISVSEIPECRDCKYNSVCDGGCRAAAYAATGTFFSRDPACWYVNGMDSARI